MYKNGLNLYPITSIIMDATSVHFEQWDFFVLNNHIFLDTGYTIALIDNVHSDIARLRGFYGIVHVDSEEGELVLTEARSGEEQARWRISSINRTFCPKTVCKKDKNKILVIITHR